MDITIPIIMVITLFAVLGSVYLQVRRGVKPRIKLHFADGSDQIAYRAKEETSVAIHMENKGTLSLPKVTATHMHIFVYAPTSLLLKALRDNYGRSTTATYKAPADGLFQGMHCISFKEDLYLFYKETEVLTLNVQMPAETGRHTIKIAVLSDQGDLGVHRLDIIIY